MTGSGNIKHHEMPDSALMPAALEAEIRYRGIMDTIPNLIFILDRSGIILEANRVACESLNYAAPEFVGRKFGSFVEGDASRADRTSLHERYGSTAGIHVSLWTRQNELLPVQLWTTARLSATGEYAGALIIAQKISGNESSGERFTSNGYMFDSVTEAMEIGVSIHSAAYDIIYQNAFLKKSYPNALGDKCYRIYRGLSNPCETCFVRQAMAQGKTLGEIVSGKASNGRKVYFEMAGVPIRDENGRITGGFEIVRDITSLIKKVEEADVTGAEKNQMQIIRGDVSQPLSGISGYSELLRKSVGAGNPAYRYATKIYEQSQRLASLIQKVNNSQTIHESKKTDNSGASARTEGK